MISYDEVLRRRLAANLERHGRDLRRHPLADRRHAAVGVVVVDSDAELHGHDPAGSDQASDRVGRISAAGEAPDPPALDLPDIPGVEPGTLTGRIDGTAGGAAVLLTRRAPRLSSHGGQWALPGGRIDPGETPLEAAVREIEEEVGLTLGDDHLLGQLDDYPTRSGYVITPFVFWAGDHAEPVANEAEVASVHRVSLRELIRPDSPRFVAIPESDRPVVQLPIGGDLIHAPTGAVLYQFRAVGYDGEAVRVDELEQPVFAWR